MAAPRYLAGPAALLVDGRPVCRVSVARSFRDRSRGLLGTSGIDGALWLARTSSVHMVGMRYPLDVAVLDRDGVVLAVRTLRPWWGLTWPRLRAAATLEAAAGAMRQWGIRPGARLSIDADRFVH